MTRRYGTQNEQNTARITLLSALFFVFAVLVVFRLFVLQVVKHSFFEKMATGQHSLMQEITPSRGIIYSQDKTGNLYPVAENQDTFLLFAVPAIFGGNASSTASDIAKILELDDDKKQTIKAQMEKGNDPYEPLATKVSTNQKDQIEKLDIKALDFRPQTERFYPDKNIFSHITGFIGYQGDKRTGQYGLEEYFNTELTGHMGTVASEKDPAGRLIGVGSFDISPAVDGHDIYLTIDRLVQFKVCEILQKAVETYGASGGNAIVQDPRDGTILAMCSVPDFDPNDYSKVESIEVYPESSISATYEPGSIFKPIVMAAALDTGSVTPQTTYLDEGFKRFGEDTITNADNKTYGLATMTQVLEESINTGIVFAAQQVGRADVKRYIEDFGFGSKLEIDMPGEVYGDVSSLGKKSDIYLATAAFGQGISTTPLQMISAFSAIANGGILYKPLIIDKIIDPDGNETLYKKKEIKRVISSKTAATLKAMLVAVVKNAHGVAAQVEGYNVGGKTGTAQIAGSGGGYINAYNHSFVGFAPVTNSRFVVFVKLDRPTRGRFSATTAAPTFAEIMRFLLNYYQIETEY